MTFRSTDPNECLMTIEEFKAAVSVGGYIDYDGYGELATRDQVSDIPVSPSSID